MSANAQKIGSRVIIASQTYVGRNSEPVEIYPFDDEKAFKVTFQCEYDDNCSKITTEYDGNDEFVVIKLRKKWLIGSKTWANSDKPFLTDGNKQYYFHYVFETSGGFGNHVSVLSYTISMSGSDE